MICVYDITFADSSPEERVHPRQTIYFFVKESLPLSPLLLPLFILFSQASTNTQYVLSVITQTVLTLLPFRRYRPVRQVPQKAKIPPKLYLEQLSFSFSHSDWFSFFFSTIVLRLINSFAFPMGSHPCEGALSSAPVDELFFPQGRVRPFRLRHFLLSF